MWSVIADSAFRPSQVASQQPFTRDATLAFGTFVDGISGAPSVSNAHDWNSAFTEECEFRTVIMVQCSNESPYRLLEA